MTEPRTWRVTEEHDNERLDKFLVAQYPNESRATVQKWVENGTVVVNGKRVTKHHFLNVGDTIEIQRAAPDITAAAVAPIASLDVLYDDEDIVVVNKPVGLIVHPDGKNNQQTLADLLRHQCPNITTVGDDATRPGIVHRLDREVSGVMVVAKTTEAFEHLKEQFQHRTVHKEYRAIVHGVPSKAADVLKFKIAHSKRHGGKMAARPEQEEGKEAWTEYTILEHLNSRYALLAVVIKTGRTHQIRAHLAAIDHPIVGDTLYESKHYASTRQYSRLFLHAYRLTIRHPRTEEPMTFEAPIPQEFDSFLS